MNDPKLLRTDPERARAGILARGGRYLPALEEYLKLDDGHRALIQEVETLRARRNERSHAVGLAMKAKDAAGAGEIKAEVAGLKGRLEAKEKELGALEAKVRELLLGIPNLPHESVPPGKSEADNRLVREWGKPEEKPFKPLDHAALGERLGILDFQTAAKLSGSRFAVLRGAGPQLQRALAQFMLDLHVREHGYEEFWVPCLVRPEVLEGTGQLPKFEQDLYKTGQFEEKEGGPGGAAALYLIPTAEVPLTNFVRDELLDGAALPRKLTAWTPCFRQEAGSYGKDTRGMIRQHQFEKVELVWITRPEDSLRALEELTGHAERVLQRLGLPYRVMELCAHDLGFASAKTYDLEVWLAGEGRYREISSCSNCWDYQARRMKARFRPGPKATPQLVHTLNGSGLAVGRTLCALLEYFQRADGSVAIPEALRPYFGADEIRPTTPAGSPASRPAPRASSARTP